MFTESSRLQLADWRELDRRDNGAPECRLSVTTVYSGAAERPLRASGYILAVFATA